MSDHLITTIPAISTCPRCHAVIVVGVAEGTQARADLTALNPAGELAALIAGRATYTWRRSGLIYRDAARITDPKLAHPVVAAHRCHQPIPAHHSAPPPPPPATAPEEGPQF